MKQKLLSVVLILTFFLMLLLPAPVFSGASKGLLLWYKTVLPTLLPFMILSEFMLRTSALSYISHFAGPFLHRIFHVSYPGSFAVIVGFLCGYPMGAKVTADLIRSGKISVNEGNYLLSFCNNTSPMFIISYLIWQNLEKKDYLLPSLCILILSPICSSFLFRFYWKKEDIMSQKNQCKKNPPVTYSGFQLFDFCMMNSFEAIIKVGGYIMLFSILTEILQNYVYPTSVITYFLSMLEITSGISILCRQTFPFELIWIQALSLTSFGGLCATAQTECMIQGTGLKIFPYIIEKLITMLVTSLFSIFYIHFIL